MNRQNKKKQAAGMKTGREIRRQEIISTAIDEFYTHGYQKASIRDIAKKVGITQAAIYYHFKNKEEILFTIIEKYSTNLFFTLNACFASDRDPLDNLRAAIREKILFIKTEKKGVKIIIEDKRFLSGMLKKMAMDKEKAIYSLFKTNLEELKKAGVLRDINYQTATFAILGTITWLYHWYSPQKHLSIERLAEQIENILFHGLISQ